MGDTSIKKALVTRQIHQVITRIRFQTEPQDSNEMVYFLLSRADKFCIPIFKDDFLKKLPRFTVYDSGELFYKHNIDIKKESRDKWPLVLKCMLHLCIIKEFLNDSFPMCIELPHTISLFHNQNISIS